MGTIKKKIQSFREKSREKSRKRAKEKLEKKPREDVNSTETKHTGFKGLFEKALRNFRDTVHILTILPLYFLSAVLIGISFLPGFFLVVWQQSQIFTSEPLKALSFVVVLGCAIVLAGFTLAVLIPITNMLLWAYPKPHRGQFYSVEFVSWYIHNGLTYLLRYSFLEWITPTPFNILFFKAMGMKIGRGSQINSSNISDPCLITLGERVTIGGSATVIAHYGMGGYLVLAPVIIHNNVTVGLRAIVMGGVEIGENSKVLPNSVVMPNTKIGPNETWAGVPAKKIELE